MSDTIHSGHLCKSLWHHSRNDNHEITRMPFDVVNRFSRPYLRKQPPPGTWKTGGRLRERTGLLGGLVPILSGIGILR